MVTAADGDLVELGLLDGALTGAARQARASLLRALLADGCSVEDLREAVRTDRLALLPSERLIQRDERYVERYTAAEVAERAGVSLDDLRTTNAALGLPVADGDERTHTDADVELAELLAVGLNAGIPVEAIAELNRVIARGIAAVTAGARTALIEATLQPGTNEHDAALLWAQAAELLVPNTSRVLVLAFEGHLHKLIRSDYISASQIAAGKTPGVRDIAVGFADLVGYTRLGQSVEAEDLGKIARLLDETAHRCLTPPARIVKTIGDAVMVVSESSDALIRSMLSLIEAGRLHAEGFPPIKVGISRGPALERAGDWYGDTVNIAARITSVAAPDTAVVTGAVRESSLADLTFTALPSPSLKGVTAAVDIFVVQPASADRSP